MYSCSELTFHATSTVTTTYLAAIVEFWLNDLIIITIITIIIKWLLMTTPYNNHALDYDGFDLSSELRTLYWELETRSTQCLLGSHVLNSEPTPIKKTRESDNKNYNCLFEGLPLWPHSVRFFWLLWMIVESNKSGTWAWKMLAGCKERTHE